MASCTQAGAGVGSFPARSSQTVTPQPGLVISFLLGFAVSDSGSSWAFLAVSALIRQPCLHAYAIISVSWEPEPRARRTLSVLRDPRSPSRGWTMSPGEIHSPEPLRYQAGRAWKAPVCCEGRHNGDSIMSPGMAEAVSALRWGRAVPCPTPLSAAALVLS